MSHGALRLVVVVAAGVQIPVEAREVAAGNFDAHAVSRLEIVARRHRLEGHFVHLAWVPPHGGLFAPTPRRPTCGGTPTPPPGAERPTQVDSNRTQHQQSE